LNSQIVTLLGYETKARVSCDSILLVSCDGTLDIGPFRADNSDRVHALFGGGVYRLAVVLIHHGWNWNYGTIVFWTSLTLLDPLIAILLFLKPKPAAIMLVILMVSDVAHNTWAIRKYGGEVGGVINQSIFLIFILLTISFVWRAAQSEATSQKKERHIF